MRPPDEGIRGAVPAACSVTAPRCSGLCGGGFLPGVMMVDMGAPTARRWHTLLEPKFYTLAPHSAERTAPRAVRMES